MTLFGLVWETSDFGIFKGKLFGKSSLFWNLVFDLDIKWKCVDFYFKLVLK